ncbi:uncharacterized protein [Macrobrachium rosenbergii]|uniref:uncharacterized protein n=1 Tax=Macrobrachium rosenbergii TaxID=79674 RepID=UPI0034D609C5
MDFLHDAGNKVEVINFIIAKILSLTELPSYVQDIYVTADTDVLHKGSGPDMSRCDHEEADSRIPVHLVHAASNLSVIKVRTMDTDVAVVLCRQMINLPPDIEVWLVMGKGNNVTQLCINDVIESLGPPIARHSHFFMHPPDVTRCLHFLEKER